MKVYILNPELICPEVETHQRACYDEIMTAAALDRHHRHERVTSPEEADMILAPIQSDGLGLDYGLLKASSFYKQHKARIIAYTPFDFAYPTIPGIYVAATPYWAARGWVCGAHYASTHIRRHDFDLTIPAARKDLLFSFVGSTYTHLVREEIMRLQHARSFLFDSSPRVRDLTWYERDPQSVEALYTQFKEVFGRTKFALCPRGYSASSMRLFEAMQAGCVPVLISDHIVLPKGPDWESFCVRIPEKEVASVPAALEAIEERFEVMAPLARAAWEQYFSPESTFESLVNWGSDVLRSVASQNRTLLEWQVRVGEYVLPANFKARFRPALQTLRGCLTRGR